MATIVEKDGGVARFRWVTGSQLPVVPAGVDLSTTSVVCRG